MSAGTRTPPEPATRPARRRPSARLWCACLIGLFERAGFYTLLSFAAVFLGELGFGVYWPGLLVGGGLEVLAYAPQVVSGALADRIGCRRALQLGSALLLLGYASLAAPLWLGGRTLDPVIRPQVTVGPMEAAAVVAGMVLVAFGRSVLSPTTASLVHEQAGEEKAVAFGFYFTMTYAGIMGALALCWWLRTGPELLPVFWVAGATAVGALATTLFLRLGREPGRGPGAGGGAPFRDLAVVFRQPCYGWFLLASAAFFTLSTQVYILLPLYLKRVVEGDPALDLYSAVIPLVAVILQLPVARATRRIAPVPAIAWGTCILALAMLLNLPPLFLGLRDPWLGLPAGSLAAILTMGAGSLGSLLVVPRVYEVLGGLAPPGREGMFLGLAAWTVALGHLAGGALGPVLLEQIMLRGARIEQDGLLTPEPMAAAAGWLLLLVMGLAAAAGMGPIRGLSAHPSRRAGP